MSKLLRLSLSFGFLLTLASTVLLTSATTRAGATETITLNQAIVGMTPTEDGNSYWFAASDGGIFTFGDATYQGSLGGQGFSDIAGIPH